MKKARVTYSALYEAVKWFKANYDKQPEPMIWVVLEDGEYSLRYGTLEEYRGQGYGYGNEPEELIYSLGTGSYKTLTEELGSESIAKVRDKIYKCVHSK